MALAYAASFGGTLSLIGTPPNGVVNALLDKAGLQPFGFFEYGFRDHFLNAVCL